MARVQQDITDGTRWAIEQGIWYSPYIVFDLDGDGKIAGQTVAKTKTLRDAVIQIIVADVGQNTIEEIDRRSGWLDTVMAPFTTAGCEAGRKAMNDEMFCSVE